MEKERLFESLSKEIGDKRVIEAMRRVPRELFVLPENRDFAYEDIPLPIGYGQTISQPFIVALMTEALELRGDERVLEIGTGSGYQTAILAILAREVVTVERCEELLRSAEERLKKLGFKNIEFHLAGDELGWREGAPYDGIIVTAGAPKIPEALKDQLKDGGRMVIPVGSRYEQRLLRVRKVKSDYIVEDLGGCRFVPLIGKEAWEE